SKSKDDQFIYLYIGSQTTSELRYLKADTPAGNWQTFYPRKQDIEYDVVHHKNNFYVRINDKGRNFRLVRVAENDLSLDNGVEIVAHRMDALLEDVDAFVNHLVIFERLNGLLQIRVTDLRNNQSHSVSAPEP